MDPKAKETDSLLKPAPRRVSEIVDRMGLGRFQYILAAIETLIVVIFLTQGTLMGVLMYTIDNNWSLSNIEKSLFGGSMLGATGVGFFCSSFLENKAGRWNLIKIGMLILIVFSIISAFMQEIIGLIICRFFVIFGSFFMLAPSYSSISEMLPAQIRGTFLTCCDFLGIVGNFALLGYIYLFMSDLSGENWRCMVAIIGGVPGALGLILTHVLVEDSPLYFYKKNMPVKCIKALNRMAMVNRQSLLTLLEVEIVYTKQSDSFHNISLWSFFDRQNLKVTLLLTALWNFHIIGYNGMLSIFPYMAGKDDEDGVMCTILLFCILQLPFMLILIFMIGRTNLGRKTIMLICSSAACFASALPLAFYHEAIEIISLSVFISLKYDLVMLLFIITLEVYRTEMRNLAIAYLNTQCRFIVIFVPFFLIVLIDASRYYVYLFFTVLEILSIALIVAIPYETQGTALDASEEAGK